MPTQVPINEQTPLNPISPYGQSKLLFEKILTDVSGAGQLAAVSLRYFNAAGAWPDGSLGEDHRPETHLIPLVLRSKEPFRIAGSDYPTEDGTCVRDFVHVCDLAEAHRLALESAQPGDHAIFNVGVGRGYSVRQVVETARQLTGLEIPSIEGPRRPSDPPSLVADTTRIQHALGFAPRHPGLETMIESAWAWHQAHPSGYATP